MIISHKYKFIFLKTRKTAGTSIEIALSKFLGSDDIITPITMEDENIRKELGYRGPQNYTVPYARYTLTDWQQRMFKKKKAEFYNHVPAVKIKKWVGEKIWNSYFKFCFERNPWDKAISQYYFFCETNNLQLSMQEHLSIFNPERLSNFSIYSIKGRVAVDYIGRYEKLAEEIKFISEKIGVAEELFLPRAKTTYRKDKRSYKEVLGEEEKNYISKICRKEIELLDYHY